MMIYMTCRRSVCAPLSFSDVITSQIIFYNKRAPYLVKLAKLTSWLREWYQNDITLHQIFLWILSLDTKLLPRDLTTSLEVCLEVVEVVGAPQWLLVLATTHFGHLGRVTMVLGSMANTCPKDYYAPGLIKLVRKLIELVIKYCMIFCSNNPMLNATDCPPHHGNLREITGEIHHGLGVSPRPSTWEIFHQIPSEINTNNPYNYLLL